jgi:hypothetical protein
MLPLPRTGSWLVTWSLTVCYMLNSMVFLASMAPGNRSWSCPTKYAMRASHTAVVRANVCGRAACARAKKSGIDSGPHDSGAVTQRSSATRIARSSSSLLADKAVCAVRRCDVAKTLLAPSMLVVIDVAWLLLVLLLLLAPKVANKRMRATDRARVCSMARRCIRSNCACNRYG